MDFKTAASLGACLAKDYAQDFFELLVNYQDLSASEAASRLGLHIRTAQEFLDSLAALEIVERREVSEKKRPYFRYTLKARRILLDLDLSQIRRPRSAADLARRIREQANSGARFALARSGDRISQVAFSSGRGRERKEHTISLTDPQGLFLYHLPFPNAEALAIDDILHKAGVDARLSPEILDIVDVLIRHAAIEVVSVKERPRKVSR
jgi:DNA-binding MarR family transcriptional regulator